MLVRALEKENPCTLLMKSKLLQYYGAQYKAVPHIEIEPTYDPTIPLMSIHSKTMTLGQKVKFTGAENGAFQVLDEGKIGRYWSMEQSLSCSMNKFWKSNPQRTVTIVQCILEIDERQFVSSALTHTCTHTYRYMHMHKHTQW